jgi:hypothetical protein
VVANESGLVHVAAPATAIGRYDLAAIFTSAPGNGDAVHVSGAVGSRILMNLPGATTLKQCVIAAPAQHAASGGGSAVGGFIFLGVLLGLVALAIWGVRRLVRKRWARRAAPCAARILD